MVAVKKWGAELSGKVIRFYRDSQVAMYAINTGRTHDQFTLKCIREITWVAAKYQFLLKAHYINTRVNTLPDALSRWYGKGAVEA